MSILVTGGLGFVGSHFVRTAAARGERLVVLDDRSGGPGADVPAGVTLVLGDIGDQAAVTALLAREKLSAVVHFAGKIQVGESVTNPELYFDVNVLRALRLLAAARAAGVSRFVFSSTAAVYGEPDVNPIPETARTSPVNAYGATKLTFEQALAAYGIAYGLRWAALRYFNAAGAHPDGGLVERHEPETHLLPLMVDAGLGRRGPLSVFGDDYPTRDGTCLRDYVHVVDLAEAHLLALDHLERETVGAANLGTGRGQTVRECLSAAAEVLGRPIPHSMAPRRPGDPAALVADPTRAETLLGWKRKRSDLKTILEDTLRSRQG